MQKLVPILNLGIIQQHVGTKSAHLENPIYWVRLGRNVSNVVFLSFVVVVVESCNVRLMTSPSIQLLKQLPLCSL